MPGVAHTENSVLTALVTGDPEKARALAERYQIKHACSYEGYDRLLRSGEIDAVYIALPNDQHRDYAVKALDLGIHVLCEKPMACTEAECLDMIAAGERSGAKLMIAYRLHFEEATVRALEKVREGCIGDSRIFSSVHTQQVAAGNHRLKGKHWAGPLPDMGPYPINAARQLFEAEPFEVFAFYSAGADDGRFKEVPEMVTAQLRFPGGRVAQFVVGFGSHSLNQYRITGTKGDLEVTPGYTWMEELTHYLTVGEETSEERFRKVDQFAGETSYFSQCILDGRHPEPDGGEGLADVRVIKALERSLEQGRPEPVMSSQRSYRPTADQIERLSSGKAGALVHAAPAS